MTPPFLPTVPEELKPVPSPVSQAVILICEKCGKKLESDLGTDENPSKALQRSMKEEAKSRFPSKSVRTVVSSCLDICPKGEIAVGVTWPEGGAPDRFFTFEPEDLSTIGPKLLDFAYRGLTGAKSR